jgi:hypothetical protein
MLREQIDCRPDQIGDRERFFAWQDPYLYRPVRGDFGVAPVNNRLRWLNGKEFSQRFSPAQKKLYTILQKAYSTMI